MALSLFYRYAFRNDYEHWNILKVLHITNRFIDNGTGITNMLADLSFEQSRSAADKVFIAAPDAGGTLGASAMSLGIRFIEIPILSSIKSVLRAAAIIRKTDREQQLDVVHVHTVKALVAVILAGNKVRRRSVATIHNVHQRSALLMLLARYPVAVSDAYRNRLVADIPFIARRVLVVKNGSIGSARRKLAAEIEPIAIKENALLYVGGLSERKGVDLLLQYFNEVHQSLPSSHLYLVGNRDNPEIEKMASDLQAGPNIHFAGFDPDPRRYMQSSAALLVPSRREAFGLVVTDARSCALPIIASNVDGLPEAMSDGCAGVLIDPYDRRRWVEAMTRVLTDAEWRRQLAERSHAGTEQFRVERMAADYQEIYLRAAFLKT